ncbi:MAG: DNA gyrase subunit A [Mollicutes bacterium]|jgi:DNA gyrase subunit A|nr:DNA gyrase subunit A [Mollicutes bacterium]
MNNEENIIIHDLTEEMKTSFLDYSMSVIISRAIPDVRDGLKPVHRRILYTMYEEGMTPDKKHQKSANAVGAIMGHYHPHGDAAIYDSMVRMAQDFTYRHTLVDGHGNFGSVDGDGAAAHRYTEARLSKISMELLRDLNKNTVDFKDNYDGQRREPEILPSRFPNILVNGNIGIAVGMATNIPPHNLGEVIDACIAYIDNSEITVEELMQYIKGPDFPTAGSILGNSGIKKAFETGKGTLTIRSKVEIEEKNDRSRIIVTELPYQVNKQSLIKRIAELVRDKMIDGISNLHDESALEGIRIVIDVKRDANANVLLNNLYKQTQLQVSYGINMLMLSHGRPQTMGLLDIFNHYVDYQKTVIIRRTKFDLERSLAREHILEGLKIALDNIDDVIKTIKEAKNDEEATKKLMDKFSLSNEQTQAILEMKLRRLTGLERGKIEEELAELLKLIADLQDILANNQRVLDIIKTEMTEIKNKYKDPRKTIIDMTAIDYIDDESLIEEQNSILTITKNGYIKRISTDTYKTQNRGGVGIKAMSINEEDFVELMLNLSTHDYIMFFTNKGKVYRLKGYEIPEYSRQAKGLPIINLLQIDKDEMVNSIIKYTPDQGDEKLVFVTKNGLIKRTSVTEFENIRQTGKICITLKEEDELISVKLTNDDSLIILGSDSGRMVVFDEKEVRTMGRTASGVRGINLDGANCIGAAVATPEDNILIVTENGYGKKTKLSEYRQTKRGSKGVKALNTTEKTGKLIAFRVVDDEHDLMIITDSGMMIRLPIEQISQLGRVTQGVRLITLKEDQKVSTVSIIEQEDEESEENLDNNEGSTEKEE